MDPILGEMVRTHTARKEHTCEVGDHAILPGTQYKVGVTLPGEGRYMISPDDYETVDWPFTVIKCCVTCYNREMSDGYDEEYERRLAEDQWEERTHRLNV